MRWLTRGSLLAVPLASLLLWLAWPRPFVHLGHAQAQPYAFSAPDGRVVLLDAGSDAHAGEGSAVWLDPRRNRATDVRAIALPLAAFTATQLRDGRVLIAGGRATGIQRFANAGWSLGYGRAETGARIFDPASGALRPAGPLIAARFEHASVALSDGRVAVIGGRDDRHSLDDVEVFDPVANAWRVAGHLLTPRRGHAAVSLADGRVLVMGGYDDAGTVRSWRLHCEIFDPRNGRSTPDGSLLAPRAHCAAVLLRNGRVLVIGGSGDSPDPRNDAEVFDPVTGRSASAGTLSIPRTDFAVTTLADGRVLVTGGSHMRDHFLSRGVEALDVVDVFDPATGRLAPGARLRAPRYQHAAITLADGRVWLAGGRGPDTWLTHSRPYDTAEIYTPARR